MAWQSASADAVQGLGLAWQKAGGDVVQFLGLAWQTGKAVEQWAGVVVLQKGHQKRHWLSLFLMTTSAK
ncbi:MAG: hypothetical protein Q8O87_01420 [bacterium]|nr:hypothetical protein [bacterium]